MTSRSRAIVLVLALVGLGFASASAWVHYRLLTDPTYTSPCDINQTFSCSEAYLSRYGSVRGIPVALGGVIWFASVALIAGFARPKAGKGGADVTGGYIFALATVALAAVLYLAYASFFVLKKACPLCMGTYVAVLGIFIVSGLSTSMTMTSLPKRLWNDLRSLPARPMALLIVLLFLLGSGALVVAFPREADLKKAAPPAPVSQTIEDQFRAAWDQQPRVDLGIPADGARVVVAKFNDWLCPGCKQMHVAYQPIFDKYNKEMPGAIKYVIKDWPWSSKCNYSVQTIPGHEGSCDASAAVRIARDRGKGDQMIDWLFSNQESITRMGDPQGSQAIRSQTVKMLGITDYDREYAAKLPDVRRDIADGVALQVRGTPTYFVNGVRAVASAEGNSLPPQYFDLAIQIELKKNPVGKK